MTRYAIFYMPPEASPLWQFGSSILGFDAASFTEVEHPAHPIFQDPLTFTYTAGPRRYGFHATLKAPFHLAPGRDAEALEARLQHFAAERRAFPVELKLATVNDFFALVLAEPSAELDRLADACVREFDDVRTPLTAEDRERRNPERLSAREADHLDRWGYPFVLDDFRFHMTLTGPMSLSDQIRFEPVLRDLFGLVEPRIDIDGIALFRQDDREGRFCVQQRFAFPPA